MRFIAGTTGCEPMCCPALTFGREHLQTPAASHGIVRKGHDMSRPFVPKVPF